MEDYKWVDTPIECGIKFSWQDDGEIIDLTYFKNLVQSLRYLTCTRSNIPYRTRIVSELIKEQKSKQMKATKIVLHYIKCIITHGLLYSFSNNF